MKHPEMWNELESLEAPTHRRIGFWANLGGGALTFAILIHLLVLLLGAIWIFQITREPEKIIDIGSGRGCVWMFLLCHAGRGGGAI